MNDKYDKMKEAVEALRALSEFKVKVVKHGREDVGYRMLIIPNMSLPLFDVPSAWHAENKATELENKFNIAMTALLEDLNKSYKAILQQS